MQQTFFARTTKTAAFAAAFFVCAAITLPGAAKAEGGLFGAIANMLQRVVSPPPAARNSDASDAPSTSLLDIFGGGKAEVRPAEGGPKVAYCVRACDGRYFPIAKNGGPATPAQTCQSMCPAAQTEVFSGSTIENAVSHKGAKYSALANAYLYREKLVDSCTCNGKSPAGNAGIDYRNDPTLRPGDIVMTEDGPVVFKGAVAPTHKLSDFVPARESKRISSTMREKIVAMKLMPTRQAKSRAPNNMTAQNASSAPEAIKKLPAHSTTALGYAD